MPWGERKHAALIPARPRDVLVLVDEDRTKAWLGDGVRVLTRTMRRISKIAGAAG